MRSAKASSGRLPSRRRLVALAAGAVVAVTGVGCGSSSSGGAAKSGPGAQLVGHVQPVTLGAISAKDIGLDEIAFGLDLLRLRCKANPTGNDVVSPASAAIALAMLDAGAKGSTRQSLSRLLHLPDWSPQLVAALHAHHASLTGLKQLKVSNHIYTQLGVHPQQQTLDDLVTALGADLRTLDFASHAAQATDAINEQVDKDTRQLIHKLFDGPLDRSTTTVLTNALYLDAAWKTPFQTALDQPFRTAGGRMVTAKLMSTAEDGQIRRAGGWTSATLPYTGGQLEAVVVLPTTAGATPAGPSCALPTATELAALTSGTPMEGPVTMPKLDLSQTSLLTNDLAKLGLPLDGDYSGFGTSGAISQVVQKTVLKVDEHGTKAAAATGIAIRTSASANFVLADRPYLLLIRDTATATPLFLTRISDPTATA